MSTNLRGFWKDSEAPAKAKPKPAAVKARKEKKRKRKFGPNKRDEKKLRAEGVKGMGSPHPDYRRDDKFTRSTAWRQLRYLALKNCDGRCQCCGARACDGARLHVDHIVPRYKAPHLALSLDNLQVLCDDCNIGKGAWDSTDWREHMRSI